MSLHNTLFSTTAVGEGVLDACSYKHEPFEWQNVHVHIMHAAKGCWLVIDK